MFKDLQKNFSIVEGAYKKIKSLYFYSKDKLFERLKISSFESNKQLMNETFNKVSEVLSNPFSRKNRLYIGSLINKITYKIFPKKFNGREEANDVISTELQSKDLTNVNFLIDMPIELMLLDCIWTLLVGRIAYDNKSISTSNYANKFWDNQVFKDGDNLIDSIDFKSNRLFKPYFKQYTSWRNNAIKCIEKEYSEGRDSILISLDLKQYFYSVDFNFEELPKMLNNDKRLKDISFLTEIIKYIYTFYTDLLSIVKVEITARTKSDEVIFPFQMCSSCFLANLYLTFFDYKVESIDNVLYYGRYVDDIIIIFNNNKGLRERNSIMNLMTELQVIEEQETHTYGIPGINVKINTKKIKVFTFFSSDPKTLIDFLKERMLVNVSSVDFFAETLENEPFENKVYYLQNSQGYAKFKDLSILQSDNYNAINYLYKLLSLNKNVFRSYDKYNNSILEFYRGTAALEFRSSWVLILYLGVLQQNKEFIMSFYSIVKEQIALLSPKELQDIVSNKKQTVIDNVKESLQEEFDIAVAIALSLNSKMNIQKEKIMEYTKLIKMANMFNHYLVSYPLINYTLEASNLEFSLIETNLETLVEKDLKIDKEKIKYSPRFISLEELNLFNFISTYHFGNNIPTKNIEITFKKFEEINEIKADYRIEIIKDNDNIEVVQYKLLKPLGPIQVAIASISLNEENCKESLKNPNWYLLVDNKIMLFSLLKTAKEYGADFIVFPECFLPIAWMGEVANFAKRNNITIITGLQYLKHQDRIYNFIANIQPFYSSSLKYKNVYMHIREKYDYSPKEKEELAMLGKVIDSKIDVLTIYDLNGQFRYCNRLCYELTNINNRAKLKNRVELVIVPEFNRDTNYFSNIIESTARDNLCFIVQSNTSIYGDSRIIGPYSTVEKNIISIKGGKNNVVLVGELDIKGLIDYKDELRRGVKFSETKNSKKTRNKFKQPSARFSE